MVSIGDPSGTGDSVMLICGLDLDEDCERKSYWKGNEVKVIIG